MLERFVRGLTAVQCEMEGKATNRDRRLNHHGIPQVPAELAAHQAVVYTQLGNSWTFRRDGTEARCLCLNSVYLAVRRPKAEVISVSGAVAKRAGGRGQ